MCEDGEGCLGSEWGQTLQGRDLASMALIPKHDPLGEWRCCLLRWGRLVVERSIIQFWTGLVWYLSRDVKRVVGHRFWSP